jgi:hypothetical protein
MRIAVLIIGIVVALFGTLFALQGFGASVAAHEQTTTWSVLGRSSRSSAWASPDTRGG